METGQPKYNVTAVLTASTSIQEFSKVFEGLAALHRSGKVQFTIRPSAKRSVSRVLRLEAWSPQGTERNMAIDIADTTDILDPDALGEVDVYLKRSLSTGTTLTDSQRKKVRPFGLNNPAISQLTAIAVLRSRFQTVHGLHQLAKDTRQLFALPSPRIFEHLPDEPADPTIIFQTRLWEPNSRDPDAAQINDERVELVRTLRTAFGQRFLGGVTPTPFARQNYPDVVTTLPFSMRGYPPLLRRPMIAVYSRGLLDSIAFKMSEYLAASRCIVGHRPHSILPRPLEADRNYLPFENADQCVRQCEKLLARPAAAAEMRRLNWEYYQSQVEPSTHLLSMLGRAFAE